MISGAGSVEQRRRPRHRVDRFRLSVDRQLEVSNQRGWLLPVRRLHLAPLIPLRRRPSRMQRRRPVLLLRWRRLRVVRVQRPALHRRARVVLLVAGGSPGHVLHLPVSVGVRRLQWLRRWVALALALAERGGAAGGQRRRGSAWRAHPRRSRVEVGNHAHPHVQIVPAESGAVSRRKRRAKVQKFRAAHPDCSVTIQVPLSLARVSTLSSPGAYASTEAELTLCVMTHALLPRW